jgi:RimJ/RimL family protein N-acetyltransferase
MNGDRLQLKALEQSDWALFKELNQCPILMKYVDDVRSDSMLKNLFKHRICKEVNSKKSWNFSITERKTGEKIGNIGIVLKDHNNDLAEVGFMLKASAQGKGYATEALHLIVNYGFETVKLNKIIAICATSNIASWKVLEKVGFRRDSILIENTSIGEQLVDDYIYSIIRKH